MGEVLGTDVLGIGNYILRGVLGLLISATMVISPYSLGYNPITLGIYPHISGTALPRNYIQTLILMPVPVIYTPAACAFLIKDWHPKQLSKNTYILYTYIYIYIKQVDVKELLKQLLRKHMA